MSPPIRALVVEDSPTVRRRLVRALAADPGFEVVGEAASGEDAVALCEKLRPDVVTLDMVLQHGMTGLDVTEHIMAYCPTPILVVSASVNQGEAVQALEALAAGAVDVIEKPRGDEVDASWDRAFAWATRMAARIRVITHLRGRLRGRDEPALEARPRERPPAPRVEPEPRLAPRYRLLAVGASTGGPGAVAQILRGLPHPTPLPVLVVIHVGRPFGAALAEWLDSVSPMSVREAVDGERLPLPGKAVAILAPPDRHLVVEGGRLRLSASPERHGCRPSVDALFESVAREHGERAIGCLLTGMGRDGAAGLLAMRRAGAATIAQDESTSVVFGMPKEAIRLGAAAQVLRLPEIGPALAGLSRRRLGE